MTAELDKPSTTGPRWSSGGLSVAAADAMTAEAVLAALETSAAGLSGSRRRSGSPSSALGRVS